MNKFSIYVKHFLYYTTFLLLTIHFFVIALSVAPANPVSHIHKQQISNYTSPFFNQNWNLFAPNPIKSDHSIELRYSFINERNDTIQITPWYDILYFSPLQRIEKYLSGIIEGTFSNSSELIKYSKSFESDSLSLINRDSIDMMVDTLFLHSPEHMIIEQYAKLVLKRLPAIYNLDSISSINFTYRLIDAQFPRFSDRHKDYYNKNLWKVSKYELGTYELYGKSEINDKIKSDLISDK